MLVASCRLGNISSSALCCFGLALCSLSLTMATPAQQSTPTLQERSQQAPRLSITTREVLLDVVVTDRSGNAVPGLTASDFSVTEEGGPQRLTHLEEHHPMSAEDLARLKAAPALPPNTFTNFAPVQNTNASTVILLDALDTRLDAQMELRAQLIDALKHLQPGTPVAIFEIDMEMRLIQGFTSDPRVLVEAANSKRDRPSLLRAPPGTPDEYRNSRFVILRSGFELMGRYLAGFPGRKNLIWLTGAIPQSGYIDPLGGSVGASLRDDITILGDNPEDLTGSLTLSRVAVYPIDARGLMTPPQFEASNRQGPAPDANLHFAAEQASQNIQLDTIAKATGGKAYYNSNALKKEIAGIVNNGSNYYTLAYATTNKTWDDRFLHIKVTVDRPGLRVQHRQGYYAVDHAQLEQRLLAAKQKEEKAKAAASPLANEDSATGDSKPEKAAARAEHHSASFEAAMQLGGIAPTEVVLTASLAMGDKIVKLDKGAPLPTDNYLEADFKEKPFRTFIVQIQADAYALRLNRTPDGARQGTVETISIVYDEIGDMVNSLTTSAVLNLSDAQYRKLLVDGLRVKQEIAVPVKGNYFLRVGVHDLASDHIGALEIPVDQVRAGVSGQGLLQP
jgi:VWFA-related protein